MQDISHGRPPARQIEHGGPAAVDPGAHDLALGRTHALEVAVLKPTRVLLPASATNRTSTSEAMAARESGFHFESISQLTTNCLPGCHTAYVTDDRLPAILENGVPPATDEGFYDRFAGSASRRCLSPWATSDQRAP